ncbi:hypothetical protein ABZ793_06085 [Micromonospora sp. NPDC047465]|uniref:hypothetical protein n=1 Tax=Micromonospora sp. NPDC047465 TaxID=3154813 RepID=UPI0034051CCD
MTQQTPLSPTEARKHIADLLTALAKDADTSTLRGHFHNRGYPHLDDAALTALRRLISTAAVAVTWPDHTTTDANAVLAAIQQPADAPYAAGDAAPTHRPSFATYLDASDRVRLDARAATAEQERDDALDQLRELQAHHTQLHTRLNATENDLRSQTRAVRETLAERDQARDHVHRDIARQIGMLAADPGLLRDWLTTCHPLPTSYAELLQALAEKLSRPNPMTSPAGLGSSRRAQEPRCPVHVAPLPGCSGCRPSRLEREAPRAQEQPHPRQPAWDAVWALIAASPAVATTDYGRACENARVWRAVEAALDAMEQAGPRRAQELPALVFNAISRALQDVWPISVPLPVVRERCTEAVLAALDEREG